jgi:hypothetical protein
MKVYKLTDKHMRTFGGFQWELLVPRTTDGRGGLCGRGYLHWYESAEVAVFMNPIHADFDHQTMRLFEAEAEGDIKLEKCLKGGSTKLTLVREIDAPVITTEHRIEIAIRCAKLVYGDTAWNKWAEGWLSGSDRSASSADAAAIAAAIAAAAKAAAAKAAESASWASYAAASYAASYAAARSAEWADLDLAAIIRTAIGGAK